MARNTLVAALASLALPALAAAQTTGEVLAKVGFSGRWARHCDRAPAVDNVQRTISAKAGAIQFREEIGKDYGQNVYDVLDAASIAADRFSIRIKLNGKITEELIMVIENDRMRTMSNQMLDGDEPGRFLVKDGQVTANGAATPWLTHCQ